MKLKTSLKLFASFFKIGLVAFGGGFAVIPLLQKEAVEHRKWIENDDLMDMMAIAQTLPGVIFVNSATMVGYRVCGFWGALTATTASIAPTFILVISFTAFFWGYTENPLVKKAFVGILAGVTSFIIYSLTKMWSSSVRNNFDLILVLLSTVLIVIFKTNAIFVIIGVSAIGFILNYHLAKSGGKA